ncbi:MAG: TlpA family protein disulfide reductase [Myxococcota bacterium]
MWIAWLGAALAAPEMIPASAADLIGRTAPAFDAEMLDGGTFSLENERGTPIVLSFWASWCGPCRLELPALDALQKTRDDITIYAVNVDRDPNRARGFLKQVPMELPVVWDPDSIALGQYDVLSMPTMFLIDENGTVKFRKTGFSQQNGLKELEAALAELTGQ